VSSLSHLGSGLGGFVSSSFRLLCLALLLGVVLLLSDLLGGSLCLGLAGAVFCGTLLFRFLFLALTGIRLTIFGFGLSQGFVSLVLNLEASDEFLNALSLV